jgi:hypothetical protein
MHARRVNDAHDLNARRKRRTAHDASTMHDTTHARRQKTMERTRPRIVALL